MMKNINLSHEIKKLLEVEEMWKNSTIKDLEKNRINIVKSIQNFIN